MKLISKCFGWLLKKIKEPLKGIYILIGVFTVLHFSWGVFVEYIQLNYPNEAITITNIEADRANAQVDTETDGGNTDEDVPAPTVDERIRQVASDEGFAEVEQLIGIAKCESGLNPDAPTNPTNGSYDRGLFQISRNWHPEVTDECAADVECSTREAIRIQRTAGWTAWACYNKYGF